MLRITTAQFGFCARMRRVASMPFMLGIAMSITTTSGDCSSASRMLSRPSAASATTVISVCFSSSARRPSRTTVWSSASSMRIGFMGRLGVEFGQRQIGFHQGAAAQLRIDSQLAAQPPDTLFHAEQSEAANETRIEAAAVVSDREVDPCPFAFHDGLHGTGGGLAGGGGYRLLHQPVAERR